MKGRSVASRLSALVGLALLAVPAHAAIETFSFVSGSYSINGERDPVYRRRRYQMALGFGGLGLGWRRRALT